MKHQQKKQLIKRRYLVFLACLLSQTASVSASREKDDEVMPSVIRLHKAIQENEERMQGISVHPDAEGYRPSNPKTPKFPK